MFQIRGSFLCEIKQELKEIRPRQGLCKNTKKNYFINANLTRTRPFVQV